ncbi:hypothetical protein I547_1920 [Mycobacterium kansasii 824]|nr:hypothetical protein I547_1920 [Mycobacterium kansasii 824]
MVQPLLHMAFSPPAVERRQLVLTQLTNASTFAVALLAATSIAPPHRPSARR